MEFNSLDEALNEDTIRNYIAVNGKSKDEKTKDIIKLL